MEAGPHQDSACFQRVSHRFSLSVVTTLHSQTQLVINTHVTVSDIHAMVSDLHHGQEGDNSKLTVSDIRTPNHD